MSTSRSPYGRPYHLAVSADRIPRSRLSHRWAARAAEAASASLARGRPADVDVPSTGSARTAVRAGSVRQGARGLPAASARTTSTTAGSTTQVRSARAASPLATRSCSAPPEAVQPLLGVLDGAVRAGRPRTGSTRRLLQPPAVAPRRPAAGRCASAPRLGCDPRRWRRGRGRRTSRRPGSRPGATRHPDVKAPSPGCSESRWSKVPGRDPVPTSASTNVWPRGELGEEDRGRADEGLHVDRRPLSSESLVMVPSDRDRAAGQGCSRVIERMCSASGCVGSGGPARGMPDGGHARRRTAITPTPEAAGLRPARTGGARPDWCRTCGDQVRRCTTGLSPVSDAAASPTAGRRPAWPTPSATSPPSSTGSPRDRRARGVSRRRARACRWSAGPCATRCSDAGTTIWT